MRNKTDRWLEPVQRAGAGRAEGEKADIGAARRVFARERRGAGRGDVGRAGAEMPPAREHEDEPRGAAHNNRRRQYGEQSRAGDNTQPCTRPPVPRTAGDGER